MNRLTHPVKSNQPLSSATSILPNRLMSKLTVVLKIELVHGQCGLAPIPSDLATTTAEWPVYQEQKTNVASSVQHHSLGL